MINKLLSKIFQSSKEEEEEEEEDLLQFQLVSAMDENTCLDCLELDGTVYESETIAPMPMHQDCRCVLVPYMKELIELDKKAESMGIHIPPSTRASKIGPIPENGGVYKFYLLERAKAMRSGKDGKELNSFLRGKLKNWKSEKRFQDQKKIIENIENNLK